MDYLRAFTILGLSHKTSNPIWQWSCLRDMTLRKNCSGKIARRAAQRVEKPIGKFIYLGVDTHIANMHTYNQYVDAVIKGAKDGDPHIDMLNHQHWLNAGFHDVWLNYYSQTLDDKKVRTSQDGHQIVYLFNTL